MALKAGRVGLNKDLVDEFGYLKEDAPSGEYYTKTQADNKFETKTHVNNNFQKKTLEVPIELLSGSALTVESALQGLNEEKQNELSVQEGTISSTFTINPDTHILKYGKVVMMLLKLASVTATSYTDVIAIIPAGYRPIKRLDFIARDENNAVIPITMYTNGNMQVAKNVSNNVIIVQATWITS